MENKKGKIAFGIFISVLLLFGLVSAYSSSNVQLGQFGIRTSNDEIACSQTGQDLLVQVKPFGCTPAVVRSDLLEENDVPVFCQLGATQINPLIDVDSIGSISISGNYSSNLISGIGFYPAGNSAGGSFEGILDNIGYVVVNLKKQANSSAMPEFVEADLTASIKYDVDNAFGTGSGLFYLPEMDEDKWQEQKNRYSFWNGKGYVRAESIQGDGATISVYDLNGNKVSSVAVQRGESSNNIYLPGFTCQAGLKVKLNSLEYPDTRAQIKINDEVVEVAQGESFLDNKCVLKSFTNAGLVQKATIRCIEDDSARTLQMSINPRIIMDVGEDFGKEVKVGDWVYDYTEGGKTRSVYLAYVGTQGDTNSEKNLFAYLATSSAKKSSLSDNEIATLGILVGNLIEAKQTEGGFIEEIADLARGFSGEVNRLTRFVDTGEKLRVIEFGEAKIIFGKQVLIAGFAQPRDIELDEDVMEIYEKAKEDYETIRAQYPNEIYDSKTSLTYGERALFNEIVFSYLLHQEKTAFDLCKELKNSYSIFSDSEICSNLMKLASDEADETYVTINNNIKKISFEGIYEPSFEEYGVEVTIASSSGTDSYKLRKNSVVYLSKTGGDYLQLISIDGDSAKIRTSISSAGVMEAIRKEFSAGIVTLEKNVPKEFSSYSVVLSDIKSERVAKVSLIPNIDNKGTVANFSVKIGIEQRAIQLAPEKTKELVNTLDESINLWGNISSGLGTVVEGLKTGCFVGGTALVAKNLLMNAGGKGIARKIVMRGDNGWTERCASRIGSGANEYSSVEECYMKNADVIDKDVEALSKVVSEQNADAKKIEALPDVTSQDGLVGRVVDNDLYVKNYLPIVKDCLDDSETYTSGSESISSAEISNILSSQNWEANQFSIEQLRNMELYCRALKSSPSAELKEIAQSELYSTLFEVKKGSEAYVQTSDVAKGFGVDASKFALLFGEDVREEDYDGLTYGNIKGKSGLAALGVDDETPVQFVKTEEGNYLVVLDNSVGNKMPVKRVTLFEDGLAHESGDALLVYDLKGNRIPDSEIPSILKKTIFERYDSGSYKNEYSNAKVRYYETEPYKGLPALVPFDLANGWYALMKQTLPVGNNIISYGDSGRLSSFYLCNVGKNSLEENTGGDDKCQMVNLDIRQPYNQFNGLSETEAKALIDKAVKAVNEARGVSENLRKGFVNILGQKIQVGEPAADVPEFQCQDIMSPKECLLLFNMCDPVICPSSRCDLDGKYPVRNVVETGVIGSVALCLPNIQEGIVIPVCLTGIKAGVDSLLSVKTATRDCLQKSLDTGETVGICDEIQSVYLCDLFWKQAQPIAELAIPKVIEAVFGQNVRGGGEYMGVADAWASTEEAINYFTNYYGSTAKQSFLARSTETVQGEFCKSFISGVVPSSGDLLGSLSQADSPPQYYGRFESLPYTTVTTPPTSQYKTFYHIYAGKDSGAYYQVYLKGDASSSYYRDTSGSLSVASGYIAVGGYASETKDLLAPTGYAELCISVNGVEQCGFKEVTTDFALDFISDKYLQSQANKTNITKENVCISGSSSVYSLLNPNLQSGVEDLINPEIYSQNIIRICATDNPGQGTDINANTENSRWKDVGYCGSENIRCWLDSESIKDAIEFSYIENQTLQDVTENYIDILENKEGYLNKEEFDSAVSKINSERENKNWKEVISLVTNLFDKSFWSGDKAKLLLFRGDSYLELLKIVFSETDTGEEKRDTLTGDSRDIEVLCLEWVNLGYPSGTAGRIACLEDGARKAFSGGTPSESTTPGTTPSDDITKLSDARQRVLKAAELREGTIVSGSVLTLANGGKTDAINKNCFTSTYYGIFLNYDVDTNCVYSDTERTQYTIRISTGATKTITMGTVEQGGDGEWRVAGAYCQQIPKEQKLDRLQPGDLIFYVWDENFDHAAIFIEWVDKDKQVAKLFDWNGRIGMGNPWGIREGERDTEGNVCGGTDVYKDESKNPRPFCAIYRYYEIDLSDDMHPVYVYQEPRVIGELIAPSSSAVPTSTEPKSVPETVFSSEETQTTNLDRSYKLERIGFRINDITDIYDKDVINVGSVKLLIDSESNCDKVNYQVWQANTLNMVDGELMVGDLLQLTDVSKDEVDTFLNVAGKGKYHVDAYCLDNEGKRKDHITSKNFEVLTNSPEAVETKLTQTEAYSICGECREGWLSNNKEEYCSAAECEFFSIKVDSQSDFKCDFVPLTGSNALNFGGNCLAVTEDKYTPFVARATGQPSSDEISKSEGVCGFCGNAGSFDGGQCSKEECELIYDDEAARRFNTGCKFEDNRCVVSLETQTAKTDAEKAEDACNACSDSLVAQCTTEMCSSLSSSVTQYGKKCVLSNGICGAVATTPTTPPNSPSATPSTTPTTPTPSYIIQNIGFRLGTGLVSNVLSIDSSFLNLQDVFFVVDSESNCDRTGYQVWEDRLLDKRISENTATGDKVSLERVNAILNSMNNGEYHVDVFCFDATGKERQHITSGNLEIR